MRSAATGAHARRAGGWVRQATFLCLPCIAGCAPGAPSLSLVGAYFPAWILCSVVGVAVGLAVRVVLAATRLAETLAYPLVVCIAIGAIVGLSVWLLFYQV